MFVSSVKCKSNCYYLFLNLSDCFLGFLIEPVIGQCGKIILETKLRISPIDLQGTTVISRAPMGKCEVFWSSKTSTGLFSILIFWVVGRIRKRINMFNVSVSIQHGWWLPVVLYVACLTWSVSSQKCLSLRRSCPSITDGHTLRYCHAEDANDWN